MFGGYRCKDFLPPKTAIQGTFCHHFATVGRKDTDINILTRASQVTRDDVIAAAGRIAGEVERTPLIETEVNGLRTWFKCECLQTGGAFKLRGTHPSPAHPKHGRAEWSLSRPEIMRAVRHRSAADRDPAIIMPSDAAGESRRDARRRRRNRFLRPQNREPRGDCSTHRGRAVQRWCQLRRSRDRLPRYCGPGDLRTVGTPRQGS